MQYIPESTKLSDIQAEGDSFTAKTLEVITDKAQQGAVDWEIISLARNITKSAKPRDKDRIADLLFWWVKSNIKFVNDPVIAEMVQSPIATIRSKAADCDCMVTLLAALNMAVGNDVRFITISTDEPDIFSHIFLQVLVTKGWRSYDPSYPKSYPGWFPPRFKRAAAWMIDGTVQDMSGWFSDIWKKIKKELKRLERRIRRERDRFTRRVTKEMGRWEKKLGPFGKIITFGAKVTVGGLAVALTGGAFAGAVNSLLSASSYGGMASAALPAVSVYSSLPVATQQMAQFVTLQQFETPFKLTDEEWKLLAQMAAALSSAVLSIVSGGSGTPLLISSAISIVNTANSAVDIDRAIKKRKKMIKDLEEAKIKFDLERKIKREAINKLMADIQVLEYVLTEQARAQRDLVEFEAQMEDMLREAAEREAERFNVRIENYKKQKKEETERYMYKWSTDQSFYWGVSYFRDEEVFNRLLEMRRQDQERQKTDISVMSDEQLAAQDIPIVPVDVDKNPIAYGWRFLSK